MVGLASRLTAEPAERQGRADRYPADQQPNQAKENKTKTQQRSDHGAKATAGDHPDCEGWGGRPIVVIGGVVMGSPKRALIKNQR